ncbi:MAG: hypothetical protein RMM58_06840 [Chloroflexota bacterium]|nr:hypothetical protein [Dehalococcoidia bacterium]MDW8253578.1 hypothetical protein [Chloroflexota bacterium]
MRAGLAFFVFALLQSFSWETVLATVIGFRHSPGSFTSARWQ